MRLRNIGLISTLALGLLVAALSAEAQQAGKVYRIGFLDYRLRSTTTDPRFIQGVLYSDRKSRMQLLLP